MSATAALLVMSARARSSPSTSVAAIYVPTAMSLRASSGTRRPNKALPAISTWRARTVPDAVCTSESASARSASSSFVTHEFSKIFTPARAAAAASPSVNL